jgi:hypothetical protein
MTMASPGNTGFEGPTGFPDLVTEKIPGSCARTVTSKGALAPALVATTKFTTLTSAISKGTCALIWFGET